MPPSPKLPALRSWIGQLMAPETTIEVRTMGLPFHFSPPPDWDTGERTIPEYLLYCIVSGHCQARLGGTTLRLSAGDCCCVPPGPKFRFFVRDPDPPALQRFRLYIGRASTPLRFPRPWLVIPSSPHIFDYASALAASEHARDRFVSARLKAQAALLFCALFEQLGDRRRPRGLPPPQREKILNFALRHADRRLQPRDLAREAGLAPEYFTRLFRVTFGRAPRPWLVHQRMRHAASLLIDLPDLNISQIATRLGYADVYLFSRQFKACLGASPRAWRQRHRPEI